MGIASTERGRRARLNIAQFLLGLSFGAAASLLLFKLSRAVGAILKQPRFISRAVFTLLAGPETLAQRAFSIAGDNLLEGIESRRLLNGEEKLVLVAGLRNFREPWARDFGFASLGLLALEQYRATRECLEVFLLHQKPDGQFPIKIHSTGIPSRYLHALFQREQPITTAIRPKYVSGHNTISLDGNGLLVMAALAYANAAGDSQFIGAYWEALKQAVTWLESFALESDGLLHQGVFSDWADSIAREGRVLYTNVIYWKALKDMAEASRKYGKPDDHSHFVEKTRQVGASINEHFWRDDLGYYVTNLLFDNLSSSGNLMAIAWDLATPGQAHRILNAMRAFGMADPVPTKPVHRPYPRRYIALENRLGGIGHYHTDAAWLWLGAWHVVALSCTGRLEEAQEVLDRMAKVIVQDGEVHEVYGQNGRFIANFWYKSEAPLTWSAGLFVYAYQIYHKQREASI